MSRDTAQEYQVARRDLLDSLLAGAPNDALAARLTYVFPPRYAILALDIGPHPDESVPRVDRTVVTTRKLRRLRHDLDAAAPEALSVMTPEEGTVLFPLPHEDRETGELRALVAQLNRAAGAPILAALATATTGEVPRGVQLAREVLAVARRSGRTDGLVRLEDLLVEYQLSRPSAATALLAERLAPVADHPTLMATLRTFLLEEGLNRRRTAAALHVHPHTVDYRLKRVTTLTGLDPVDAGDAQLLLAAFAARELVDT